MANIVERTQRFVNWIFQSSGGRWRLSTQSVRRANLSHWFSEKQKFPSSRENVWNVFTRGQKHSLLLRMLDDEQVQKLCNNLTRRVSLCCSYYAFIKLQVICFEWLTNTSKLTSVVYGCSILSPLKHDLL